VAQADAQVTLQQSLAGFLAIDRRIAIAAGRELPTRALGAVLFADLVGFTTLVETLGNELGPRRGAEELSLHMSRLFEKLTARVHSWGGSVVTFIGDAMLCWFDAGDGVLPDESSARAAHAAFALQRAVDSFTQLRAANGRSIAFALKIGIAAGSVRRFVLGSETHRLYDLLAGRTVDRAVSAASRARPGEVVVSQEILSQASVRAVSHAEPNSEYVAVAAAETAAATSPWSAHKTTVEAIKLRPWLPAAVFERLTSEQSFLAEFRSAIPLFLHFEGIDVDADGAGAALNDFVSKSADVVRHYGGELLQVVAGDKGNHLYATFGVPVAHDDDEERAMAAALELRQVAARSPGIVTTRIGLSRGRTFVGLFGAPSRSSYAALGDTVNLAARLMAHATPGQILVSDRIKRDAAFTLVARGTIQVKGRAEPVALRELVARRDDAPTQPSEHAGELVGRDRELESLLAALGEAHEASFAAVIDGDAGIGKSRLLGTLVGRVPGARVLAGWADSVGRQTAYHAWVGVLRGLLSDGESTHLTREALTTRLAELGPEATRRAPLLAPLLRLEIPDNDLTAQMTGDVRANSTRMLVADLLTHAAKETALLLTFEDLHWFDSASWALLRDVRRRVGNLKIVVTARPLSEHDAAVAVEYRRLLQEPGTLHVTLGALPPDDALLLACRRLGVSTLPPAVARVVRQRAEGNPLYVRELVLAMLDAGHILVRDGECTLASGLEADALAEYPETVEGIVASRIDKLSPDEQLTVKVASVIGRRFPVDALRDVHPSAPQREALDKWLATLELRGLTSPDVIDGRPAFIFTHAILQQVVYDSLLFAHRRGLHRAVAEWLEREESHDLAPHFPSLARHWEVAGDVPRTLEYLERAGEQATNLFANDEAISFLTKAQQMLREHVTALPGDIAPRARQVKWSRLLGRARLGAGDIDGGYAAMRDALRLLRRPEPGRGRMAFALLGHVMIQTGHRLVGPGWLSRVGDRQAALESAEIYQLLSTPYFVRGDWLGGLYANWYSANIAERYGADAGLLALAMTNLGGAWLNIVPIRRIGDWYLRYARQRARDAGDFRALGWNYLVEASVRVLNCNVDEAQQPLDEARRILRELGDGRRWEEVTYFLTTWHFYCGRYDASAEAAREQLASAQSRDDAESQLLARNQLALVAVARNDATESALQLSEAARLHERGGNLAERVCTLGIRALALARAGDVVAAVETLRAVSPLLDQLGISNLAIEGFSFTVEAVLTVEDAGVADPSLRALARKAWRLLARNANTMSRVHRARAMVLDGVLARREGRAKRASKRWPRAIARAERDHVPYESARARLELANELPRNAAARVEHLNLAIATFERLGTQHELARALHLRQGN